MRQLLQLTLIVLIAVMAIGLVSADGVTGTTTPSADDGSSADDADCDEPDCGNGMGGAGGTGGANANCIQNTGGDQNQSLSDWGWCGEGNMGLYEEYWADYYLTPLQGMHTLEIGRTDGADLEGICSYDNIDGIQGWTLHLETPDRIAKYKKLDAPTTKGTVWFQFDGNVIPVNYFAFGWTKESFNNYLINRIELAGFVVEESENYVRVKHAFIPQGISHFTMRLQNDGDLLELAVALEPDNPVDELLCRYAGIWW